MAAPSTCPVKMAQPQPGLRASIKPGPDRKPHGCKSKPQSNRPCHIDRLPAACRAGAPPRRPGCSQRSCRTPRSVGRQRGRAWEAGQLSRKFRQGTCNSRPWQVPVEQLRHAVCAHTPTRSPERSVLTCSRLVFFLYTPSTFSTAMYSPAMGQAAWAAGRANWPAAGAMEHSTWWAGRGVDRCAGSLRNEVQDRAQLKGSHPPWLSLKMFFICTQHASTNQPLFSSSLQTKLTLAELEDVLHAVDDAQRAARRQLANVAWRSGRAGRT